MINYSASYMYNDTCKVRNTNDFGEMFLKLCIIWDIFIPLQHEGIFRSKKVKNLIKIGTPQRKILIVFLYYISLGALALTTFTLVTRNYGKQITETLQYFECQKSSSNNTCSYYPESNSTITAITLSLTFSLIGCFPAVNLVYVVNFKATKAFWK